jgi:hypothetical protein
MGTNPNFETVFHLECYMKTGGWVSIVDIMTHCGLDGPGFESLWR